LTCLLCRKNLQSQDVDNGSNGRKKKKKKTSPITAAAAAAKKSMRWKVILKLKNFFFNLKTVFPKNNQFVLAE
jgi:hypothetical protein